MKKLFFSTFLVSIYLFLVTFARPSLAIICNPVLSNCLSSSDPQLYTNNVVSAIISIFFIVGIIYFLWHIIFAGYHFIATEGDPKAYETAKNQITYSLVGIVVIFSIFGILKFVGVVLGIQGLENLTITWPKL